jgi:pyruvate formate lyase activating enzyme
MKKGIVFNIQRYAVHDGPGIRVTVFLKGCPLRCWWCHNPESQQKAPETVMQTILLEGGKRFCEEEILGTVMTVEDVMREIEKDVVFFDESGGGATFSGGEPLMQPEFLNALLERCQAQHIHTALDTTGYAPPDVFESLIEYVDLFLYDLKLIDESLHRKYTGVSNRLILENLQLLAGRGKQIVIRFPVIPTITDTKKNIIDILNVVTHINTIQQIYLLPYHRIAEGKYQKLNKKNKMVEVMPPSKERLEALRYQFEQHGLDSMIEG